MPGQETEQVPEAQAPASGRSAAMIATLVPAVLFTVLSIYFVAKFGLASFVVIFIPFAIGYLVLVGLGIFRPRPWVYLVTGILLFAFFAINAPFLVPRLLSNPVGAPADDAWAIVLVTVLAPAGGIAGIVAFLQARRHSWTPGLRNARGPALVAFVGGLALGAMAVSFFGAQAAEKSGGAGVKNGLQAAPTGTPMSIEAKDTKYSTTSLSTSTGETELYFINRDNQTHTFDADLPSGHVAFVVQANSTGAFLVNVPSTGTFTYYCAVPGHRATMEGRLTVQ